MSKFHTLSAILRGMWLIQPEWVQAHIPVVARMLKGEQVNFGLTEETEEDHVKELTQLSARGYKVGYYSDLSRIPDGSVAIVDFIGPVVRYGGMCSLGTEHKKQLLTRLYNSSNVLGIVLNTDSPGGEASGSASFAATVAAKNKPVIGFVEDGIAASAAYWAIAHADEIYASNKTSEFGSIGAYTVFADWLAYFESEGLKVHEIYAPQSTEKNKEFRNALQGDYTGIEAQLKFLVDNFIGDVKAGREGKLNTSAGDPFKGKLFYADEAKKIGLIDGISTMEAAIDRAVQLSGNYTRNRKRNHTMSNKKTYSNIAATAGWDNGHESDDEGLHLSHDDAGKVDQALADAATAKEQAAKVPQLEADLKTAKDATTAAQKEAAEWKQKAELYGANTDNPGTTTTPPKKDKEAEASEPVMDDVTAQAMKVFNANKHRKQAD